MRAAAGEVLDQLGITEPVDWVGNAWGGHVGITLAVSQPHRLRSLVTIAAPVTPVSRRQRWTQTYPLALLYRLLGPNPLLTKMLFDALLGSKAIAAHPDRVAEMKSAFRAADRESIRRTIRFMHSWRPLTDKLPAVAIPTLLIAGNLGDQHWRPGRRPSRRRNDARRASSRRLRRGAPRPTAERRRSNRKNRNRILESLP